MENTTIIELKNVTKSYGATTNVVENLNLSIRSGEFITLLGPSGCGKTTLLRMIGGFEEPTSGAIFLRGKDIAHMPPHERPVNTVFQKYALFPFLNVYDNITFGLKARKVRPDNIPQKVAEVLDIVDLAGFEKRRIQTLSGGQQQRVAIARAIINEPEILLLDESLSALDYKMRQEMQIELRDMQKELGITFVFVTHDQEEAMTMSDRIVVLSDGQIQQVGTPEEIYKRPRNIFVADFIGTSNIYNGYMTGESRATFLDAEFFCGSEIPKGSRIRAVIRPEDVLIVGPEGAPLTGTADSSIFKGDSYEVKVLCDKSEIIAKSSTAVVGGMRVGIDFKTENIHLIREDSQQNLFKGIVSDDGRLEVEEGVFLPKQFESDLRGKSVSAYFAPSEARMSDNVEEGFVDGNIISAIFVGDHYVYTIRSKNEVDYTVDDEWLWNIDDHVSVVVPAEAIHAEVVA